MTAPTRAALSRELIARTALAITDEGGLSGLSMRKLGNELGVEAMSLYHYVENKDDLLDAILDCLYAEVVLPVDVPVSDWETGIRLGLASFHDVLVEHPAAMELFASRPGLSEEALQVQLWCYHRFQAVGLDLIQSCMALHFGVSFVMGHVANGVREPACDEQAIAGIIDGIEDPQLSEFLEQRMKITSDQMFSAGLDAVVEGMRAAFSLP